MLDADTEARVSTVFAEWADQGELPDQLARDLHAPFCRQSRRRRIITALRRSVAAAVAAILITATTLALSPEALFAARQVPLLDHLITTLFPGARQGWVWARENGFLQDVSAEATCNGYTLQIDGIMADPGQTTIFWSVRGDHPASPDFLHSTVLFNGAPFTTYGDMTADYLAGGTDRSVVAGSFSCAPLPADRGTIDLTATRIGSVEGDWRVSFAVDRSRATAATAVVDVGYEVPVADGKLTVGRLVLAPTQTTVEVKWVGPAPGDASLFPRLTNDSVALLDVDGKPAAALQQANLGKGHLRIAQSGREIGGGLWEVRWMLSFDRVDPDRRNLLLRLGGSVCAPGTTSVPLTEGATPIAADGCKLTVTSVTESASGGNAVLEYDGSDTDQPPYERWQVRDQNGTLCPVATVEGIGNDGHTKLILSWELPEGHKAVELVSSGYRRAAEFASIRIRVKR
jgi:hypothetical protein